MSDFFEYIVHLLTFPIFLGLFVCGIIVRFGDYGPDRHAISFWLILFSAGVGFIYGSIGKKRQKIGKLVGNRLGQPFIEVVTGLEATMISSVYIGFGIIFALIAFFLLL